MICPHCGTNNTPEAEWCYLCQNALGTPSAHGEAVGATGAHGELLEAPHSIAMGPTPGDPYRPNGMGAAASRPEAASGISPPRRSARFAIYVGLSMGVLIIVVMAIVLFGFLWRVPKIKTPTPPGWFAAGEAFKEAHEASSLARGEDITIVYVFLDDEDGDVITIGHADDRAARKPRSESHEDVESFLQEERADWEEYFSSIYAQSSASAELLTYETVDLSCGISALHMCFSCQDEAMKYTYHFLAMYKNDTQFFVNVRTAGSGSGQDEVDFLLQNISFD